MPDGRGCCRCAAQHMCRRLKHLPCSSLTSLPHAGPSASARCTGWRTAFNVSRRINTKWHLAAMPFDVWDAGRRRRRQSGPLSGSRRKAPFGIVIVIVTRLAPWRVHQQQGCGIEGGERGTHVAKRKYAHFTSHLMQLAPVSAPPALYRLLKRAYNSPIDGPLSAEHALGEQAVRATVPHRCR